MKIGIPRALVYWKKPFFWEIFFEGLGFKILLSPKTNKEIVETGVKISDPETCFSNKIYFGHIKWLDGRADYIFVPRLKTNERKLEFCPKFFGLPDIAKILVKTKILTETFDGKKTSFEKKLFSLGKQLKKSENKIKKAISNAFLAEKKEKEKTKEAFFKKLESQKPKVLLVSHPYNLSDDYVNLRVRDRLEKLGLEPILIEEIEGREEKKFKDSIPYFHWEFAVSMLERIDFILSQKIPLLGAIQISSFACGCDAPLKEFVEKKFKEKRLPFLYLIIDENTGEAGFQTRLEAFVDTVSS